eukprot:scaffold358459_cov25-Prasinocladus_malaysianus.AAC.1
MLDLSSGYARDRWVAKLRRVGSASRLALRLGDNHCMWRMPGMYHIYDAFCWSLRFVFGRMAARVVGYRRGQHRVQDAYIEGSTAGHTVK